MGLLILTVSGFIAGLLVVVFASLIARKAPTPRAVLYAAAAWPIVGNLNSPREVSVDPYTGLASLGVVEWSEALTLPAWIVMGALLLYVLARLATGAWRRLPISGRRLLGMYMLFATSSLVAALLGTPGGGMSHTLFRPHVVVSAFVFASQELGDGFLPAMKKALGVWLAGSLIAAAVSPDWAMFESGHLVDGPLPFPRLYGVCSHPNGLAPLGMLYLYLEYLSPTGRLWRVIGVVTAVAVVVMAQSKTVWVLFAVFGLIVIRYRQRTLDRLTAFSITGAFLAAAAWTVRRWYEADVGGLTTLTGRTRLWSVAFEAWQQNPLFGYGPTTWSSGFRQQFSIAEAVYAGQAHNAWLQALAESGLLGLGMLSAFVVMLGRIAWRSSSTSRGLSLVLFAHLALISMTESNMLPRSVDHNMLGMGMILSLAILLAARQRSGGARLRDGVADLERAYATSVRPVRAASQHLNDRSRSGNTGRELE